MKYSYINFTIVIILLLSGCFTPSKISRQNLSFIYRKDNVFPLNPNLTVYHVSNDSTRIYVNINSKELTYKKENENFVAKFKIKYKLFSSYESKLILDSASVFVMDIVSKLTPRKIIHDFSIPIKDSNKFLLLVEILDVNKGQQSKDFITIDKTNRSNRQNFLLKDAVNGNILFRSHVTNDETIRLESLRNKQEMIFVSYYNREFELAAPPFFNNFKPPFNHKPDSVFTTRCNSNLKLTKKGFYHFRADTSTKEGFTLFLFYDEFPNIASVDRLVLPIRYITSQKEFDAVLSNKNAKQSVDRFWLGLAGSKDRARKLIKNYYGRVREANRYFSSHMEGWKTDRGIIYVIYGAPHAIYKNSFSETWIYGDMENVLSSTFNFTKVNNPYTDNDYDLERQVTYQNSWYLAVDHWRQGIVFNPQ